MKQKLHNLIYNLTCFAVLLLFIGLPATLTHAAEHSASVTVNRATGECLYTMQGLDPSQTDTLTLQVLRKDTSEIAFQTNIALTSENCPGGIYTGSFSLETLNRAYDTYTVNLITGDTAVSAGTCDFSIHADKLAIQINGNPGSAARDITVTSTEAAGDVVIPGPNKSISVMAWPEGSDETTAQVIVPKTTFTEGGMKLTADVASAGTAYDNWNAKLVLENEITGAARKLAAGTYSVIPTLKNFTVEKTKTLEKKKSFGISLDGLENVYGVKSMTFTLLNSKGKKAANITAKKKTSDGSKFYAEVSMKQLGYVLDRYTIQATLTDKNGTSRTLEGNAMADMQAHNGILSITKSGNASCTFKLTDAYIPGNIKKMRFVVYEVDGNKQKRQGVYNVKNTAGKKKVSLKVQSSDKGEYKVEVYGYTSWGKKIFLNEKTYRLRKKDMGKNGWYYEKYNGKTYKFYYINNVKQIDLTDIVNLQESNSSNTNRLYIEVNRAACTVTIYLYNNETKKYDIPIKTCAVSVGSDTSTVAGTGGLHEKSSYTPIGTYSICTNGTSVKYTVKQMYEPDGRILYARWTSHIVGNVYFHSVAVSTDSHYALPSYRYNLLGSPASAGCIRMTVADAKWIYDYASTGTTVKISKGDSSKPGPLGKPPVIKTTGSINYDPTDPAVPDSRKKADYKAKRITGYMTRSGKKVGY